VSVTSAACDVPGRGEVSSSRQAPVIAKGRISRSGSARFSACSAASWQPRSSPRSRQGEAFPRGAPTRGGGGKNRDVAVEDGAELAAGGGRVLLGQPDHRGRVADLAGAGLLAVEGGQSS